jgi:hypothetical protein
MRIKSNVREFIAARRDKALRWILCALAIAVSPAALHAQHDEVDPVDSAGEALRGAENLPWYDAASDDIRPLPPEARDEPPPRPTTGRTVEPDLDDEGIRVRAAPFGFGPLMLVLGVIAIAAVFIVIFAFIISSLLGRSSGTAAGAATRITQSQADNIEELPVPLARGKSDLLGEARRQYERGDYSEAIIYLYSYLLVELDKASRIRLVRGKTNRQYLGELRDSPALVALIGEAMIAFEDVYFGERSLTRERFEGIYRRLDEFHSHLELVVA